MKVYSYDSIIVVLNIVLSREFVGIFKWNNKMSISCNIWLKFHKFILFYMTAWSAPSAIGIAGLGGGFEIGIEV